MATQAGTGISQQRVAALAVAEAAAAATAGMTGRPDLVIIFASSAYDHEIVLREAAGRFPGAPVVGCSSAGEFTRAGSFSGSLALMAIQSDAVRFQTLVAKDLSRGASRSVAAALATHQDEAKAMHAAGFSHSTIMVLTDGLRGGGEQLVQLVYGDAWISDVVGGAAGDDGRFTRTSVFINGEIHSDAAVLIRMFSRRQLGIGVQHGMQICTEPLPVTRAEGSVVHTIGDRPAFDYYRDFARGRDVELTPPTAGAFMMTHELAIYNGVSIPKIRAPLSVGADGSLNMAAEIPEGSKVSIVDADPVRLIRAAHDAGDEARRSLGSSAAGAVLVFDCICRRTILDSQFSQEVDAIAGCFDAGVPLLGFATYGEIARFRGTLNGFHNSTVVVCALPA